MSLNIQSQVREDFVYCLKLTGSLDQDTYPDFQKAINNLFKENARGLILMMEGLSYLSSAGIGALVSAKNMIEKKQGAFSIVNLQPQVKKVLEIMRLSQMLNIS